MSISDPQINLNRLGSMKKNDRNEIKSLEYSHDTHDTHVQLRDAYTPR